MSEDPRIQAFRKALNEWKRQTFFTKLVEETDTESINRRIEEAHSMFAKLMEKLHSMEQKIHTTQQGGENKIQQILETLGTESTWTEALLDRARSALITDLYEYPLTFNSSLIDQFKGEPNFPLFE